MPINAVDHVNIVTDKLDETADFYEKVLGLRRGESPGAAMGFKGAWMFDSNDRAIVHLVWLDPERSFAQEHKPGTVTGSIHHVAFQCSDFAGSIERLKAHGIEHSFIDEPRGGFRQIVLVDPNNINLELSFHER